MLDCEQSLFSQSSLSAAGLERASASCFLLSLASLDFPARVLRDCSQSTLQAIDLIQIVIKPLVNTVDVSAEYDY